MSWVYRRPFRPQQKRKLTPSLFTAVTGDQTINGVLFTKAPTFPTGQVNLQLNGVLFTRAPTFATGQVNLELAGVLFTRAPTFATGQVNLRLNGVVFTRAPTFPTGAVQAQPVTLAGVLFTRAPTFPTGQVNLQAVGVLFTRVPTFATGQVNLQLNGVLFTRAPTFPVGDVSLAGGDQTINGVLFAKAPTFPTGQVNLRLVGATFTRAPTFPTGTVNLRLAGVLFTSAPIFAPLTNQFLDLPGTTGNFASTPDIAAYEPATSMRVDAQVAPVDYSRASDEQAILAQVNVSPASHLNWFFRLTIGGNLECFWDGAVVATSTVPVSLTDGEPGWTRMDLTLGAGTGVITFYESRDRTDVVGSVTWQQISTHTGLTLAAQSVNAPLRAGEYNSGTKDPFDGGIHQARYTVDGSAVAHFDADDFTLGDSDTDTAVDVHGRTWTLNGAGTEIKVDLPGRVNLRLNGVLFTRAPTFPTGDISLVGGDQTLNGVLFTKAPTFPTGSVDLQLDGVLFSKAVTFATGSVTLRLNGILFTRAPTFPTGAVNAQPVTITGVLFTRAPTFPTGIMRLAALTFWEDDKVAHTDNKVAHTDAKVAYTKLEPSVPNPL